MSAGISSPISGIGTTSICGISVLSDILETDAVLCFGSVLIKQGNVKLNKIVHSTERHLIDTTTPQY